MDDPIIIPTDQLAAEEAAATKAEADKHALREFISQWELEELPACPEGMEILLHLEQRYPSIYAIARNKHFRGESLPPNVAVNAAYRAFVAHFSSCADCNEGGAKPIPYNGREQ